MGSHQKKKKRTKDTRAVTSEIKRQQDLDANRLAIQPTFEGSSYAPRGVGLIEFCNVSTTIGPSQTIPPGLPAAPENVTVQRALGSEDTQLNVFWNQALANPTVTSHKAQKANNAAFTGTITTQIATMPGTSIGFPALTPSTTYYFRVSGINSNGEGPFSAIASMSTAAPITPPPPATSTLWLKLDNNLTDSSGLGSTVTNSGTTFGTPGQFGSHFLIINPTDPGSTAASQYISLASNTNLVTDLTTVGFSISLWIYPFVLGSTGATNSVGIIIQKSDDTLADNAYSIELRGSGELMFLVVKAGTEYKVGKTGFVANSWQHICCTFNATTNTAIAYRNGVAGTSSSSATFGPYAAINTTMYVGRLNNTTQPSAYYQGRIDEIQYFKGTVLTQAQVTSLMNTNTTS